MALPLALEQVSARLRSSYYRQPEALAADVATIAANAAAFNGEDSELAEDGSALAGFLTAVLAGQVRREWGVIDGRLSGGPGLPGYLTFAGRWGGRAWPRSALSLLAVLVMLHNPLSGSHPPTSPTTQ